MKYKTKILGSGHFLPEQTLTNADIEKLVETSDQWITERTGIKLRHVAATGEGSSDLALRAARQALEAANLTPKDIDAIFFATATPDTNLPNSACQLQSKLGAGNCVAWDLNAACSGFLYVLSVARHYIGAGTFKRILVVGAETLTRFVNYKDRETCILFGDGAGAWILGQTPEGETSDFMSEFLSSDGTLGDLLHTPGGGFKQTVNQEIIDSGSHFVQMKGREIFKSAVRTMGRCAEEVMKVENISPDDVKWVIPHQANTRIIEAVSRHLDIPIEKFILNLEHTGNTSSASVPIAFNEAVMQGKIQRGDLMLLTVFGAGITSGALLMRY